jgi:hypothetical protein
MERKREDLAWVAGFFDGEGCISAVARKGRAAGRCSLRVSACQVDPELLHRLRSIVGFGNISCAASRRNPISVWRTGSFEEAHAFIAMVWHWLSAKRKKEATRALSLMAVHHALNTPEHRSQSVIRSWNSGTRRIGRSLPRGIYRQTLAPHHYQARAARLGKIAYIGTFATVDDAVAARSAWLARAR